MISFQPNPCSSGGWFDNRTRKGREASQKQFAEYLSEYCPATKATTWPSFLEWYPRPDSNRNTRFRKPIRSWASWGTGRSKRRKSHKTRRIYGTFWQAFEADASWPRRTLGPNGQAEVRPGMTILGLGNYERGFRLHQFPRLVCGTAQARVSASDTNWFRLSPCAMAFRATFLWISGETRTTNFPLNFRFAVPGRRGFPSTIRLSVHSSTMT